MEEIVIDASNNSFLNGATNAQFRFRFRSDSGNVSESYSTTSDGFFIDDFKIISIQVPCATTVPTGVSASSITPVSATIGWDNIPSATYDLRYKETSSGTWIEVLDLSAPSHNLTGLTASTNYEVQTRSKCGVSSSSYSSSTNFATTAVSYCNSNGNGTYDTGVTQVSFNTLSNSHINNRENSGYQDFLAMSTTVIQGSSHTLTVNVDRDGGTGHAIAWIDFNIDGDFEDTGEEFDLGTATTGDNTQTSITPSISFPSGAGFPIGQTRMRIAVRYNNDPTGPCATGYDGEVEDYSVNILPSCSKPVDIITNATICSGETYNWAANSTDYTTTQSGTRIANDGCTADLVLNLTVTPKPADIVTNASICSGETYNWAANSTDYTTTQSGTRIANDGCTADLVLNLTVTPKPADIVTNASICFGRNL